MDSDSGNHTFEEQSKLSQNLRQFLLVSRSEAGLELADKLAKIHAEGAANRYYRLTGEIGFFSSLVSALLVQWGHTVLEENQNAPTSSLAHDIYIPGIDERRTDRPTIISFFAHRYLASQDSEGLTNRADNTSISGLLLLFILTYKKWGRFEELQKFIEQSICFATPGKIEFAESIEYLRLSFGVITARMVKLRKGKASLADSEVTKDLAPSADILFDLFMQEQKWTWSSSENAIRYATINQSMPNFQDRFFAINHVQQVCANILALSIDNSPGMDSNEAGRITTCLFAQNLRANEWDDDGLSDEEVAQKLNFLSTEEFQEWAEKFHVNRHFRQPDDTYEKHIIAEERLGLVEYSCNSGFTDFNINGQILKVNPARTIILRSLYEAGPEGVSTRALKKLTSQDIYEAFRYGEGKFLREKLFTFDRKLYRYYINPRLRVKND